MNQKKEGDQEQNKVSYITANLNDIIKYFAQDFTTSDGEITSCEHWIDINKQEVVFRLFIEKTNNDSGREKMEKLLRDIAIGEKNRKNDCKANSRILEINGY